VLRPLVEPLERFHGFGPCRLASDREPAAAEFVLPAGDRRRRQQIRRHCLPAPGVYGMIDADEQLIYVGKSKSLRDRLLSYFSSSSAPSKARRIIARTKRLVWENAPHEFAALVRELELIRRFRPRYNVRGQPRRLRQAYVCIGRGPAAYVYLAARPSRRDDEVFGPVRGHRRYRRAVRMLNDCLGLRNCSGSVPVAFSEQLQLFGEDRSARCLRYEFGTCLAPCAAACSSREYGRRVRGARDFLQGTDLSLLHRLEAAMRSAAAVRQFERAAGMRDTWEELGRLRRQLQRLREARRRYSFLYPLPGYDAGRIWCLIEQGHVVGAVGAPTSREQARACCRLIERVYATNGSPPSPQVPEDLDMIHLVAAWFRDHPDQRERTLSPEDALKVCRRRACGSAPDGL
jgi:excinuclease ABC subunit C